MLWVSSHTEPDAVIPEDLLSKSKLNAVNKRGKTALQIWIEHSHERTTIPKELLYEGW